MRVRALAGIAAAGLLVALALAAARPPGASSPQASPTPEPAVDTTVAEFIQTHAHTSQSPVRFAWLLSDVVGTVILPEDEKRPAAVLGGIGRPEVSPGARHLSWWTNESRGVRQLRVFDTMSFASPRVILETEVFLKLQLLWSTDEQLVAFPVPDHPSTTRITDLTAGTSIDGDSATVAALSIWSRQPAGPAPDPGTSLP